MPSVPDESTTDLEAVFQNSLVNLAGRSPVSPALRQELATVLKGSEETEAEYQQRHSDLAVLRRWAADRRARGVAASQSSRQQPSGSRDRAPRSKPAAPADVPVSPASTDPSPSQQPQPSQASDGADIYMPPSDDALSAGYESPDDRDSLGSLGELVGEDDESWFASIMED